ncbi:alpha/beta fold hydrolase [Streptomyces sp. NPDC059010]|uniref:alpha/beta fold hydrolase n=1 Tax=Streptomyces sp. NPDC059010 TaxID=3346695 RepID=UPI0036B44177
MIDRRVFGKALGVGTGAAAVSLTGLRGPQTASAATFPQLKQVRAGLLNVGYAELGPAHGPVVICLHGWPYDIHSYVDVAPLLAERGYRVVVPYLRGHGTTRFRSDRTFRNAQQSAVALDVIALMDALKIEKAVLAGFDWGSRTADIVAALWPERCKALVSVSGYLVTDNPDYAAVVVHNYRWRLSLADGERRYDALEKRLAARPTIGVPTITLDPECDPFTAPGGGASYRDRFTGAYEHRTLPGVGHNVPQEAPAAFARAVIDVNG